MSASDSGPDLGAVAHVGIVTPDIEALAGELTRTLGVRFPASQEQVVEWRSGTEVGRSPVRLTWSVEGPPHLELLQGPAGTVWAAQGASHLHHLGYWADDVAAASAGLSASGLPLEIGGLGEGNEPDGFAYHTGSGLRVEVLDSRRRRAIARWLESVQ